jgi:threonine dehydrogenase-like Zn-dependent dehydrogenase
LSLDQLALVEPLSIGAHAVARAGVQEGEFAVVVGAGPIGLSVTLFARLAGARVIVMDINEERLGFAREHLDIEDAIVSGTSAIQRIKKITGGDLPTIVFDATGNQRSMDYAFNLPSHGGRLVFVGLFPGNVTFNDPDAHRRELTILMSRNATGSDFKKVMGLLESGIIDINPWITHRVLFGKEVIEAFPVWLDPKSNFIKAVIEN